MARIEVSLQLIEESLFGRDAKIKITDIDMKPYGRDVVFLEIEGPEVPKVDEVYCEMTETYRTVKFFPVKKSAKSDTFQLPEGIYHVVTGRTSGKK